MKGAALVMDLPVNPEGFFHGVQFDHLEILHLDEQVPLVVREPKPVGVGLVPAVGTGGQAQVKGSPEDVCGLKAGSCQSNHLLSHGFLILTERFDKNEGGLGGFIPLKPFFPGHQPSPAKDHTVDDPFFREFSLYPSNTMDKST